MTIENQKTAPEDNTPKPVPDNELFAGEIQEELSESQVFAGNEEFYKSLGGPVQATTAQKPAGTKQAAITPIRHKTFSNVQKILLAGIVLIVMMLLYTLLTPPPDSTVSLTPTHVVQQTPASEPPVTDSTEVEQKQIEELEPVSSQMQPLSLAVAQNLYLKGDYHSAYGVYNELCRRLPATTENELVRDFLQLQMALCMKKAADLEQASRLLRTVSKSRSLTVRMIANYHRSLLEIQRKQYLNARARVYQVIALIDAVDLDEDWRSSLRCDCHFVAAEAATRNVLSLCDADKDCPMSLWSNSAEVVEPFSNLNESQLQSLLDSDSELLSKALLAPQVQKLQHQGSSPARYVVICRRAPLEELLARFAANAGLDVHWALDSNQIGIRKRAVSLYLPAATTQQIVTIAAGCAGLLAHLDEKGVINIFNPQEYSSLSEHISLLSTEAISLWQRFLLAFHDDSRISNAHFALGLLQSQEGRVAESIAEYRLVANRFSETSLAPFALLLSSKVKTNLRDYLGARQDLSQLVEQYPDIDITGQAYLCLADVTAKAGLKTEAGHIYRKIYNLGLSLESQSTAALGAGMCFYEIKDYESAAKWLNRYISLAKDRKDQDLYSGYFFLGKTYLALGQPQQACGAFQPVLAGPKGLLSAEEYVETVSVLAEGYMRQGHFVEALNILENIPPWKFSQKESTEILLLKSRILKEMGLLEEAIAVLGDRAEYISEPQLKGKILFELTDCWIAKGNLELAHRKLTEILVAVEPGQLAYQIALKLADVCLKLGQNSQAASVCLRLLDLEPPEPVRQRALEFLAMAYVQQKNYDRAVLALVGQWK